MTTSTPLTQDELKALVGQAALRYVVPGDIVGVGTGSTVNKFIDALATIKDQHARRGVQFGGQHRAAARHRHCGVRCQRGGAAGVYIDGADEIDGQGHMVKGGGAALTREKIVAALARQFVCIADESKLVPVRWAAFRCRWR
jgi:ribose 5-phosphate isomerase A